MSDNPYSGSAIKRSAGHFIVGKGASALLTFTLLLWLVRLLSVTEYAAYITLLAALDVTLIFANVGLPWMDARYLPEFRLHASKAVLSRFVAQLIQYQLGVLLLLALTGWLCLDWILVKLDMVAYVQAAQLYIVILVVDGLGRRLRDSILTNLLLQKLTQINQMVRNIAILSGLGILYYLGEINLAHVVAVELVASTVCLLLALIGLWRHLKGIDTREKADWKIPKWSVMWRMALNMYFSEIITQVYGVQVFTLVIRYTLGEEPTAVFGFLRNLYGQTRNYLPATLLFGLIRPKLVASYVGDGGIAELTRNANMVGKISLFILMPLLVFSWLAGEELVALLSGGKFLHTGYYFPGFLSSLILLSQRQILETVAMVTGNSHLCNYAGLLGVVTLPMAYLLIEWGFQLWAPILALWIGSLIFSGVIIRGIEKKTAYRADLSGYYKMLFVALLAYLASQVILVAGQSWMWIVLVGILASGTFLLTAAIIKPFSDAERLRINQLIKRNLFVW
jgi:O-antigen/teichoic acid export membrane protein